MSSSSSPLYTVPASRRFSLSHRIDIVQDKLPCLWAVRSVDLCWVRISPMHLSASPEGLIGGAWGVVGVLAANVYVWALTSILGCKSHLLCWSPQMPSCQISWAECFIHGGVHRLGPELMHYPLYTTVRSPLNLAATVTPHITATSCASQVGSMRMSWSQHKPGFLNISAPQVGSVHEFSPSTISVGCLPGVLPWW